MFFFNHYIPLFFLLVKKKSEEFSSDFYKYLGLFLHNFILAAHIRTKRLRYTHRIFLSVKLKVVFQESNQHSGRCNNRIVKRMREIFLAVFRPLF